MFCFKGQELSWSCFSTKLGFIHLHESVSQSKIGCEIMLQKEDKCFHASLLLFVEPFK